MRKKLMNSIFFFICFFVVGLNAVTDIFHIKSLHGDINLCAFYSTWDPALQSETQEVDFISSETLGEASLDIKGHLEYSGYSIFKIDYVIPLKNTPDMKRIIDYNSRKETGVEKFQLYFVIDAIMNKILAKKSWKYLRYLTRLKYNYQRRRFITNAENNSEFFYIPEEATYNSLTEIIDNGEYIEVGTKMVWNTEIIEQDITLHIFETSYKVITEFNNKTNIKIVPAQLRIGYFSCYQKQPASGIFTYNGFPTIMDVHLKSGGLVVQIVTINEEEPGLNLDWHAKLSGSSIKSAAYDLYKAQFNSDAWGSYAALGFDTWYNIRFSSRCLLIAGLNFEINAFLIEVPNDSDNLNKEEDNSPEIIWRVRQYPLDLYVRFGYRF